MTFPTYEQLCTDLVKDVIDPKLDPLKRQDIAKGYAAVMRDREAAVLAQEKLQYAVVYLDEGILDTPLFGTEQEAIDWWLNETGTSTWQEAVDGGSFQVQGFTQKELDEMPEGD